MYIAEIGYPKLKKLVKSQPQEMNICVKALESRPVSDKGKGVV